MLLTKEQLIDLFDQLGTPNTGRKLVWEARIKAPVREVKSSGGNVVTHLASRKMTCEVDISTESRHVEFPAAILHEFDPAVLEYYTQPCELKLELIDPATGEIHNIRHVPDFLVIRNDGIFLEEWKTETKLNGLAARQPFRYVKSEDGWFSPGIEEQLADWGIQYRLRSDRDIPRRRVENLLHLADYFHPAAEPCPPEELARLQAALDENGHLFVYELLAAPYHFKPDHINKAIVDQQVVADLNREDLSNVRRSRLFRDTSIRDFLASQVMGDFPSVLTGFTLQIEPGAQFRYERQIVTIALAGENEIVFTTEDGATINLSKAWLIDAYEKRRIEPLHNLKHDDLGLSNFSEDDLRAALQRQAIIDHANPAQSISPRTIRRWVKRKTQAMLAGANPVLAMVPNTKARGNRTPRLSAEQSALMEKTYHEKWLTSAAVNFSACHKWLVEACQKEAIKPPSLPTFIAYIHGRQTNRDIITRHGSRVAYQQQEFVTVLYYETPIHGCRPFQYVHVDHTQVDIECISSRNGVGLGRPWLTVAVDAYTRRILAIYLSYDPPSYHSVMMVVRHLVCNHGRLPEFFIVDNGADLVCSAFELLLKALGTHLRRRPKGKPRHGSVMERLFGVVNTQYVHNLAGNTKATKQVRMVSGKHLPSRLAEWTLESLYYGITYWAFHYYDQEIHPALGISPREAEAKAIREKGARPQRHISYNTDFLIATCPPVDRTGHRVVSAQRGVKHRETFFWSAEFRNPDIVGANLPTRYDPWDAASVYVNWKGKWIHAVSSGVAAELHQLTEMEYRSLSPEFRKRFPSKHSDVSPQRLGEFLRTFTSEGALAVAMERHLEVKNIYGATDLGQVFPNTTHNDFRLIQNVKTTVPLGSQLRSIDNDKSDLSDETTRPDDIPDFDLF